MSWAVAATLALALPARAGQFSDLWFNPQESGWGMNVVQQLDTAFVTLFVYGPDGKPTWYVAPAVEVIAYSSGGGLPVFAGALYKTEGPYHAGPFDPSKVKATVVGSISLEALALDRVRVYYRAEGSPEIVREVVRQTWQAPVLASNYAAQFVLRQAHPGQPPYGTRVYQGDMLVHFDQEAFIRVDDHLGVRCEYRGPYQQSGKIARVTGSFTCDGGDSPAGSFEITELEVTQHGVSGYLRTSSAQTSAWGRFAAVRY
jgi:hypothetical protein